MAQERWFAPARAARAMRGRRGAHPGGRYCRGGDNKSSVGSRPHGRGRPGQGAAGPARRAPGRLVRGARGRRWPRSAPRAGRDLCRPRPAVGGARLAPHQLLPGALRYGNRRRSFLFPSFELCEVYKLAAGERGEMRIKLRGSDRGGLTVLLPHWGSWGRSSGASVPSGRRTTRTELVSQCHHSSQHGKWLEGR